MKNLLSFVILFLSLMTVISSCKKDPTPNYSCDPEINKFVIAHKGAWDTLTRSELARYDPYAVQVAIYRSLSPKRKAEMWIEKLDSVLLDSWTQEQDSAIKHWKNSIDSCFFHPDSLGSSVRKAEEWLYDALNDLNIDSSIVWSNFCNLATVYDWTVAAPPGGGNDNDCRCRWDWMCYALNFGECVDDLNDCEHTTEGCGWFNIQNCTGLCDEEPEPTE